MAKKDTEKQEAAEKQKVTIALAVDHFVDGKDRQAGYVVYDDGLVGTLKVEDFNFLLKKGFLRIA